MRGSLPLFQGEYEIVANDYDKAKTLFANTKVSVFKKGEVCVDVCVCVCDLLYCELCSSVLTEVENQLSKFREDLKKKLLKLPSSLEEQKRLIK